MGKDKYDQKDQRIRGMEKDKKDQKDQRIWGMEKDKKDQRIKRIFMILLATYRKSFVFNRKRKRDVTVTFSERS